jgi:hypothetical protein
MKLKPASRDALRELAEATVPAQELNPGVVQRLRDDGLADFCYIPSPSSRPVQFVRITDHGRAILREER